MPDDHVETMNFAVSGDVVQPSAIDIRWLLGMMRARWKLVIGVPLLTLLFTCGVLRIVPQVYKSTVEILIFDPQEQVAQDIQKTVSPFRDVVDTVAMSTEIEMIKSRSLALRVAEELHLNQDDEFLSSLPSSSVPPSDAEQSKGMFLDRVADAVRKHIDVQRVEASYILALSATSRSPTMAQRLAATAADVFLSSQREARENALRQVMTWLKSRLEDLQARIQADATSIENLKATDTGGQNHTTDQEIVDLSAQLALAQSDVAEKLAHFEQANDIIQAKGDLQEIPEVRASNAITQLRLQATQLSWHEIQLRSALGANHEAVIAAHNQVVQVNKTISDEALHVVDDVKNAYDIAVQREQSLEKNLQKLTVARGSADDAKMQELQRGLDADRKLYESYVSQYNELATNGTSLGESARIISGAVFPDAPSSPRRLLYYGFSGVVGLGVGFAWAFLLEYLRRGVKSGTEAEQAFGHPVLGTIPLMRLSVNGSRSSQSSSLVQGMVDAPLSELGEAVRSTRLTLRFANPHQIAPRAILVTSSVSGEGKSTAAMLLAASSAASGQRTILMDCDLRHLSISEAFGMPQLGLVDLLEGTADIAEVTIQEPTTGIHVIPAGAVASNVADLLASERMRELIATLRERYDYVVLDASPLLPVVDALALATMIDKVLVVVEWGRTPRDVVLQGLNTLRPEAHRIAGIVLNKVDPQSLRGYQYGYALY
jgi:polysaccharide biosynthesis transport protein